MVLSSVILTMAVVCRTVTVRAYHVCSCSSYLLQSKETKERDDATYALTISVKMPDQVPRDNSVDNVTLLALLMMPSNKQ